MNWFMDSFKGMTKFEKGWLTAFSAVIMLATFYFSSTASTKDLWSWLLNWVVSPVSAWTGVVCVVLCAKGKWENYIWGFINALTYGIVAWVSGYYGDALLNIFFFIPSQFFIYFMWKNSLDDSGVVEMKRLKPWTGWAVGIGSLIAIWAFAQFLMGFDNFITQAFKRSSAFYANLTKVTGLPVLGPLLDSSTVVLQIVAQVLLIKRFAEQWPLWVAVDVLTIGIWSTVIATDPTSVGYAVPTLIMWCAFLTNAIYGTLVWYQSSRADKKANKLGEWLMALYHK